MGVNRYNAEGYRDPTAYEAIKSAETFRITHPTGYLELNTENFFPCTVEKGKRVIRLPQTSIDNDALTAWLIEAAVRYAGKPVSVPSLQSLPVLFPFTLTRPLAYVVSNSANLILRSEGPSNQFVALRSAI